MALASLLFNWPSAGGNIHTAELAHFLARAGYTVRHFFAHFAPWNIGSVSGDLPHSQALGFTEADWNVPAIGVRFRAAVGAFGPDCVIISDSWNMKPHLAARPSPATPCCCASRRWSACARSTTCASCRRPGGCSSSATATSSATPPVVPLACASPAAPRERCTRRSGNWRAGAAPSTRCRSTGRCEAAAVLALNPKVAGLLSRFAPWVQVVPWGMDPDRFPWPSYTQPPPARPRKVVLMAGLVEEPMKGFTILHAACAKLWQKRKDFELVATAEPAGRVDEWTRLAGWLGQQELPKLYAEADVAAVPTVAQEGLSRTSAEAMAAGQPVVTSRLGGRLTGVVGKRHRAEELAAGLAA